MSRIEEHIKYRIDNTWERLGSGKIYGEPIVKIDIYFPEQITADSSFLKDISCIFQKIEKQYNERLRDQKWCYKCNYYGQENRLKY